MSAVFYLSGWKVPVLYNRKKGYGVLGSLAPTRDQRGMH